MNGNDPDIKKFGGDAEDADLFRRIKRLIRFLMLEKKASHSRVLSTADYFIDRWERSEFLGFGKDPPFMTVPSSSGMYGLVKKPG